MEESKKLLHTIQENKNINKLNRNQLWHVSSRKEEMKFVKSQ